MLAVFRVTALELTWGGINCSEVTPVSEFYVCRVLYTHFTPGFTPYLSDNRTTRYRYDRNACFAIQVITLLFFNKPSFYNISAQASF